MRKARCAAVAALFVALLFLPHAARGLPASDDTASDDTPPIVSYTIDGIAGTNDWFRGSTHGNNITLHWSVSDPESPIISTSGCEPAIQINGPNTGTTRTCSATSDGGTTTVTTRLLKIDATPPVTTAAPSRPPNLAGWYRASLSISWSGVDPTSGVASCRSTLTYNGPDTTGTAESGTCTDNAGNSSSDSFTVRYDTVAPTTDATPSRGPNAAGWYRAPLSIAWVGSDVTSGLAACSAALSYGGPDTTGTPEVGSCTDNAGNSSSDTFTVRYDTVAPNTDATPSRQPNGAGWYRAPVSVDWTGTDGTSGIASCRSRLTYSGPDTSGATQTGSCTDNADNSSSDSVVLHYDATAPDVNATPSPAPNANGWLRSPVTVSWSGIDATSGIASCSSPVSYSAPDTAGTNETGSCTDNAGNSSADTFVVRLDRAAPNTDATPARPPNGAGWYRSPVSISWSGTDGMAGIDSCSTAVTYSGPDTTGATRTGSCTDRAGNSSSDSLVVRYDATAPFGTTATAARGADHDGWYNHQFRIDWSGSDATSGIASCTSRTYSGPDGANASSSGNCTDVAGNISTTALGFQYDATDPVVAVTADRNADHAGWYNRPVGISWSGTDATSGIDFCDAPVTYSGPDRANASSVGGCTDEAGNSASPPPLSFRYDATAPVTGASPDRAADANGWYNHALRISWAGSDPTSGIASCTSVLYSGPDAGSVARTGRCTDQAGNASPLSAFRFRYDATAPGGVGVAPARQPDHDGWYNRPLAIRWFASDLLAGIASCTSLTYGGPDETGGRLSGACTDRAGNRSATLPFALRYDEDVPALRALTLKGLDDAVALRWRVSGASELQITRSAGSGNAATKDVYSGTGSKFTDRKVENYVRYRYTLTAQDPAGNIVQRTASVTPLPVLYAPRPGAHLGVHARPSFAWKPAKKARYYNFQLWVDGRQVGSWWPARARLRLPARWSHDGETHRLEQGTYTWYVWPGRGSRKLGRYGALLGKSSFVVG
jgi:large repetitive protein